MKREGYFISLEGIDGCGKSSLKECILSFLDKYEVVSIREPGGTYISEKIRDILLDVRNKEMKAKTEAMLYAAARSQVVEEVIRPALARGKIVVTDRYIDSTIAYQGYGRGLDLGFLKELNKLCTGGLKPHLTILLDLSPEEAARRRKKGIPDRLEREGVEFQSLIRNGYLQIAQEEPQRIKVLDARGDLNTLVSQALKYINMVLGKN